MHRSHHHASQSSSCIAVIIMHRSHHHASQSSSCITVIIMHRSHHHASQSSSCIAVIIMHRSHHHACVVIIMHRSHHHASQSSSCMCRHHHASQSSSCIAVIIMHFPNVSYPSCEQLPEPVLRANMAFATRLGHREDAGHVRRKVPALTRQVLRGPFHLTTRTGL
jgi:hypothetical protein